MSELELAKIAYRMVSKGQFDDEGMWRYIDDLYKASHEEKDKCADLAIECLEIGQNAFKEKYDLK